MSSLAERLRVTTLRESAESAGVARLPETLAATAATQPVLAARRAAAELAGASSTERLPSGIGPATEGLSRARIGQTSSVEPLLSRRVAILHAPTVLGIVLPLLSAATLATAVRDERVAILYVVHVAGEATVVVHVDVTSPWLQLQPSQTAAPTAMPAPKEIAAVAATPAA